MAARAEPERPGGAGAGTGGALRAGGPLTPEERSANLSADRAQLSRANLKGVRPGGRDGLETLLEDHRRVIPARFHRSLRGLERTARIAQVVRGGRVPGPFR